jgi:hypothetical protein
MELTGELLIGGMSARGTETPTEASIRVRAGTRSIVRRCRCFRAGTCVHAGRRRVRRYRDTRPSSAHFLETIARRIEIGDALIDRATMETVAARASRANVA